MQRRPVEVRLPDETVGSVFRSPGEVKHYLLKNLWDFGYRDLKGEIESWKSFSILKSTFQKAGKRVSPNLPA